MQQTTAQRHAAATVAANRIRNTRPVLKRVGLYCRVSTAEQAQDGTSMFSQEQDGLAYIDDRKDEGWVLHRIYRDPGISGAKESRPDFDEMRADMIAGNLDVVLVKAIDRIGRSERVLMPFMWLREESGIDIVSLTQPIDTTTAAGQMALSMFIIMAQAEWNAIRERTQRGINWKAQHGGWVCGVPPYGYMIEGKGKRGSKVVACPAEVKVIKRAAHLLLVDGKTPPEAAAALNAEDLLTRSGVRWTGANLKQKLQGPILDGYTTFRDPSHLTGKTAVKLGPDGNPLHGPTEIIPLPQVLDDDTVQGLRDYFSGRFIPRGSRDHVYYLSGRMTGTCGGRFVGRKHFDTKKHYYFCSGHENGKKACRYYHASDIENEVWEGVIAAISDKEMLTQAADDWLGTLPDDGTDYAAKVAELDAKILRNEEVRVNKLAEYAAAGIDPMVVKAAQDKMAADAEELVKQRDQALELLQEIEQKVSRREHIIALSELSPEKLRHLVPELRAQVVEILDVKIEVVKDATLSRTAKPCQVRKFLEENEFEVPATLTDEQWERVTDRCPNLVPGPRQADFRAVMEWGFRKVREEKTWTDFDDLPAYRSTVIRIWKDWLADGTVKLAFDALGEYEGTPIPDSFMPELRVTGVLVGELAVLVNNDDRVRSGYTAPSGTVTELRSKSQIPLPHFTVELCRSAA